MRKIIFEQYGGPEVLTYVEEEIPKIKENEILIKVENFSVNYADVKKRTGKKAKGKFPMELGLDVAGVVQKVGGHVKKLNVGDRVVAFPKKGSYSEYVVADENLVFKMPKELSFEQGAAALTVSFLGYILVNKLIEIDKSSFVIVHAASGGVGTTILQLLNLSGIENVIGVTSTKEKFPILKKYGAKYTFTYEEFQEESLKITQNKGVDIVFDSVAGEVTRKSLNCLKEYGKIVQFGNSSGERATFNNTDFHSSCRSIIGFSLGTTRKLRPDYIQSIATEVLELLASGKVKVHIENVLNFDSIIEAHKIIENRNHVGKVLIEF